MMNMNIVCTYTVQMHEHVLGLNWSSYYLSLYYSSLLKYTSLISTLLCRSLHCETISSKEEKACPTIDVQHTHRNASISTNFGHALL